MMDILSKAQSLLQHMYDSGGGEFKEFRFITPNDLSICHASNSVEFGEILDYAKEYRWLKWRKRDTVSLGRAVYHGVQLTYQGMERISQKPPAFESLPKCPLTGLPLNGQATFEPLNGAEQVLYSFKPVGRAIFNQSHLIEIARAIAADNYRLRPDLAALCREASERKEPATIITYEILTGPSIGPDTFEEKQAHLLRLLYETGGKEFKERDLFITYDFLLAYANDSEEFTRILKALITKGLIQYDKPNDTPNDWPGGIRTNYYGVLPTLTGQKQIISESASSKNIAPMHSSTLATSIERIFISHSSKDSGVVEEIIDLLEIVGVRPEQIFCSSFPGYSIEFGQDFLQRIKDELNGNVLVIFVLSHNFYNSPVSLCEMGAAWVQTRQHIPVLVPPLSYDEVRGVIPLTQGFKVNEPLKWNLFKEQLEGWFICKNTASASVWERKRDKAIQSIDRQIASTQSAESAKATPRRRGGSPSTQAI